MKHIFSLASALLLFSPGLSAAVDSGLDVLIAQNFKPLAGKRIGLIANQTAVTKDGRPIADVFATAPGITLAAIFSPEHGFSGSAEGGAHVADSTDTAHGVRIYSLYGKTRRPAPETLKGLDALVFDIADVGARFYTYLTTMGYALEAADRAGLEFFVLDRPNPAGGAIVEGPVLDPAISEFTAYFAVPVRHGFTPGEMALFHAAAMKLKTRPRVIVMKGWKRPMFFAETGLRWINPSPNIRNPDAAIMYSGTGCFEASNLSVGRGTDNPFMWIGAPWFDPEKTIGPVLREKLDGVEFKKVTKTPAADLYAGQACPGMELRITDKNLLRPVELFVAIACALRDTGQPVEFRWSGMKNMTGSTRFEELYKTGASARDIMADFDRSNRAFVKTRRKYLLY
ncbi:MAG: DUF1343 domain-containing protein [Elusimicrobiaceae bacterium]|nr:DUF1343 domain-containing protein [Elusimicrobiaceae bacterium]